MEPKAYIITDGNGNSISCHYNYYPATPPGNMSGRFEDAEIGSDSEIDALNVIATNKEGQWVAIHDLLDELPGFHYGQMMAQLKERADIEHANRRGSND